LRRWFQKKGRRYHGYSEGSFVVIHIAASQ
jgi:hypothetical protein